MYSVIDHGPSLPNPAQYHYAVAYTGLGLDAICDALITVSTYYYVRRANRDLDKDARQPALERFLRVTAETNALTFVVVLANVAVLALVEGFWMAMLNEPVPVIYTISMLATLLSRSRASEATRERGTGKGSEAASERAARAKAREKAREKARDVAWTPQKSAGSSLSGHMTVTVMTKGSEGNDDMDEATVCGVDSPAVAVSSSMVVRMEPVCTVSPAPAVRFALGIRCQRFQEADRCWRTGPS